MKPQQKIVLRSEIAFWKAYRQEWGEEKWQNQKQMLEKKHPAWYARILISRVEA